MAKKDLAGLVGGIIGNPAVSNNKPIAVAHTLTPTNEVGKKSVETRATFVCSPEQIRKLKYIALASGRLHKQVVADAFDTYIADWEAKHGAIALPSTD